MSSNGPQDGLGCGVLWEVVADWQRTSKEVNTMKEAHRKAGVISKQIHNLPREEGT